MHGDMTSRERVLCALSHAEPDRVPLVLGISNASILAVALERLGGFLGIHDPVKFQPGRPRVPMVKEEILLGLGIDVRPIFDKPPKSLLHIDETADVYTDEWGVVRKKIGTGIQAYYEMIHHPLENATIDDLDSYPWPDPEDPDRVKGLREEARHLRRSTPFAVVGCPDLTNIFELAWYLRGVERFLIDLIDNKEFAHALLRKLLELHKARLEVFFDEVEEYLDMIHVSDDLAAQTSLLISPRTYREMIKPYQAEYFAFIKEHTKAKILYHCCGNIYPLIGDLIEIGIDILNPIQVSAGEMRETAKLKSEFGSQLAFCGGIDTQSVLSSGTPDDVRAEVRRLIQDLAPRGGYLLAAVHNIQNDVPAQNILTMFQSAQELGRYPLHLGPRLSA